MTDLDVLIVDDDHDVADSLAEVLEDAGHTVTTGYSGEEAIKKFRIHYFDLVLMDVIMPGMNGIESMIVIKKEKPGTRVLLMTGFSVDQLHEMAINEGALGILHKPINPDVLLEVLK